MPEINHPSIQAAFRPAVSSCVPAFVGAFCNCAVSTFQKQQHACLPHGSRFPASAICKQHGRLTRSTNVTACSACVACDALDSSQCMPEINHPSSQAANRPFFTSCVPAIDSAFCDCIVPCHLSRAPTCMHDSQVRVSRRPAYSGPRLHSSPRSPLRRRPQMHGTHRCCSLAHFCIVLAGPLAFC